jgi:hypothetical protein
MSSDINVKPEQERDMTMEAAPTEPARIHAFARFFKSYMSVWAVVTAALPIPATLAGFIPTYGAHTKLVSAYTSLFCFLVLALIFYSRHVLARYFFPSVIVVPGSGSRARPFVNALPAVLIALCVVSAAAYLILLTQSVSDVLRMRSAVAQASAQAKAFERLNAGEESITVDAMRELYDRELASLGGPDTRSTSEVLADTDLTGVPHGALLVVLYLFVFVFAEGAFILMALREYLQDVLGVTDKQIINVGFSPAPTDKQEASIKEVGTIRKVVLWLIAVVIVPVAFSAFVIGKYQLGRARGGFVPSLFSPRMGFAVYGACSLIGISAVFAASSKPALKRMIAGLIYLAAITAGLYVLHGFLACWYGDCR